MKAEYRQNYLRNYCIVIAFWSAYSHVSLSTNRLDRLAVFLGTSTADGMHVYLPSQILRICLVYPMGTCIPVEARCLEDRFLQAMGPSLIWYRDT